MPGEGDISGKLRDAAAAGRPLDARNEDGSKGEIPADLIRRLVLSLPLGGKTGPAAVTPAGIEIHDAIITGRIALDRVIMAGGAPVLPIEFHKCFLAEGFSGAHAHFSRLAFRDCTFGDPDPDEDGRPVPTIELSDAHIHSDLDLEGVAPEGVGPDCDPPRHEGHHLWIMAVGARIDGEVNLNRASLRAPPSSQQHLGEDPPDALDLSLANVAGDFRFRIGSRAVGRIKGRNARFGGDVWLSGACLDGAGGQALLLQSARIAGLLVIDSRYDDIAGTGTYRWFRSRGEINLHQLQLGGKLFIKNVNIQPSEDCRPSLASSGFETEKPRQAEMVGLTLEGARIGASVEILADDGFSSCIGGKLQFASLEVKTELCMRNLCLGVRASGGGDSCTIDASSLTAEMVSLTNVRPITETASKGWFHPPQQLVSIDLSDATIGALRVENSRFTGCFTASPLRCTGDVFLQARVSGNVDLEGARIGGSLDIANLRVDPTARYLSLKDATIGRALKLARQRKPGDHPPTLLRARRTKLCCLGDTTLIETLWQYQLPERKTLYRQAAFLERKRIYYLMDRRSDILGDFVRRHGHLVTDPKAAREYFRLHCNYGSSELRFRWLVPAQDQLPPFAVAHPMQRPLAGQALPGGRADADAADLAAPSAGSGALAALKPGDFIVECDEVASASSGRTFEITARLICEDLLARARFRVDVGRRRQIGVRPASAPERGVRLAHFPVADGQHLEHPAAAGSSDAWIMPPAMETHELVDDEERDRIETPLRLHLGSGFSMQGRIDLENLSCTALDDRAGRLWGSRAVIDMNHFVYRQATWHPRIVEKKPSHRLLFDWLLAKQAEWVWPFRRGRWADRLRDRDDYWEPWQLRRNWIYQQFSISESRRKTKRAKPVSKCRHKIAEKDYRPQPFEQVIRVARAEGREDFAIQFEMLKQRIEWRIFNRMVRWWLGFAGLLLGTLWLAFTQQPVEGGGYNWGLLLATLLALAMTLVLMVRATNVHRATCWVVERLLNLKPGPLTKLLTWIIFFLPVLALLVVSDWGRHPFHFIIAFLIFIGIRFISVFAHGVMRAGFGYLRRPVRAIVTLIAAFLVGWLGVYLAKERHMLVIAAEPVASLVAPDSHKRTLESAKRELVMGSENLASADRFVRDISCRHEISEPLYALDVLIPLIDLREESRCEIRRIAEPGREIIQPGSLSIGQLWASFPNFPLDNNRFWWWMNALYAIAGWFIVSLSILTFAQVNRMHAEPPHEHK